MKRVYDGRSSHRQLWRGMLRDLRRAPPMARLWLRRGFAADLRPSLLGGLLLFLPPLGLVLWALLAQRGELLQPGPLAMAFPVFVLVGVVLWQTFLEALNVQIETLGRELPTLAKLDLPPEAFILAGLGRVLVHLAVKMLLVVAALAWLGVRPGWGLLAAPLALAALLALGTALGLLLAPFAALYRDVSRTLQAVTLLWLFLTPVFYQAPGQGPLAVLMRLNPVSPLLSLTRDLLVLGRPTAWSWELNAAIGLVVLLLPVGWFLYRLALPIVIERTGA
ncbi:MAG: ABC transporter permease [Acidobacteriota bacterium]